MRQGQQGQLNGGGKASGVGHLTGRPDFLPVMLGQTIDKSAGLITVVRTEINDLQGIRHLVLFKEFS
ncbi:hypothetical protein D9M68_819550 [compost metagenome]